MSEVAADICALIRKKLPAGRTALAMEDRLADLGIDSLGLVELIFDLEEEFNIQIPYNANDKEPEFETVGEVIAAIKNLIDKKA
jgi:acyl carrier protein